jgi:acylphosphatase
MVAAANEFGSPMAREQLQVYYSGRVQGVGFRATVKRVAHGYDVTGFVRNLLDGRVELVAEGEPAELGEFQQAIRDSGLGHFIRQEEARRTAAENGFRGFEIVR